MAFTNFIPPSNVSVGVFNSYATIPVVPSQIMGNISSYENEPLTECRVSEKTEQFAHLLQTTQGFQTLDLHPLIEIFKIIVQEANETVKQALRKPEGYFHRLFSTESWEEWSEHRTPLGRMVNLFANYVKSDFTIGNHLNFDTLQQANTQAERLLKQLKHSENIEENSSLFSKIVNFNFISGTQASSTTQLDSECAQAEAHCKFPTGSYLNSCLTPTITYLSNEDSCLLKTKCSSMFAALPPQDNELEYKPDSLLTLGNQNGTLTILKVLKPPISPDKAKIGLNQNFEEMQELKRELNNPAITGIEREKLELKKEGLEKKQAEILGRLHSGSAITLNEMGWPAVIIPETEIKLEPYMPFQRLSASTGGLVGFSSKSDDLPRIIEKIFDHILQNTASDLPLDIAFILDTTSSMDDDMEQVKKNLITFLGHLKRMKNDDAKTIRVAILEYRDYRDDFLNRVTTDFTSELDRVATSLNKISTGGGGDSPEAAYDALLAAKSRLSWGDKSKRVAMIISDASPHPKTVDGLHDEKDVTDQYQAADTSIVIYPIITGIKIT